MRKLFKRAVSALLTVVMLLGFFAVAPVTASADPAAAQLLTEAPVSGGYYVLSEGTWFIDDDATLEYGVRVNSGEAVLDLNGYTLRYNGSTYRSTIYVSGGQLTVNNGTITGGQGNSEVHGDGARGGGVAVNDNAVFTGNNLLITGNVADWGGGIFMDHGCVVTLNHTVITNNRTNSAHNMWGGDGGGVFFDGGKLILNNSQIYGNISENHHWAGITVGESCDGIELSGDSRIYNNLDNGVQENIYINGTPGYGSNKGVSVVGELSENARFGITMANPNAESFTLTPDDKKQNNDPAAFVSDVAGYVALKNTAGQLMMVESSKISSSGWAGLYDGQAHGITVNVLAPDDAEVYYGTVEGTYDLSASPTFTNVGSYPVYYQTTVERTAGNAILVTGAEMVDIKGTVSFSANGGTGTMNSVETAAYYILPENGFTAPAGKVFTGWLSSADGVTYQPRDAVTLTQDTTFTAQWAEPVLYTASYAAGGGSGTMDSKEVASPRTLILPANRFTGATGAYVFTGWLSGADSQIYQPGDAVVLTADTTFTAQWYERATYTVSFNANGGSGTMDAVDTYEGDVYTLPACSFTAPAGYLFTGWSDGADIYAVGASYPMTGSVTFTAQWTEGKTATFAGGGGTGVAPADILALEGTVITLPANTFTPPAGYMFAGWSDGVHTYNAGAQFTLSADTAFTAQWAEGVLMPYSGTDELDLSEKTAGDSVLIFDDGGPDGNYSDNADGYLSITIPAGKALRIVGPLSTENHYDKLYVYGGTTDNELAMAQGEGQSLSISSTDSPVILHFNSDSGGAYSGFALTATVCDIYSVTYYANNGTEGSLEEAVTSTYNLPSCSFAAPAGKIFAGWKWVEDNQTYSAGDEITLTGGSSFYAQWQDGAALSYTLNDDYGDSWNGAYIVLREQGSVTAIATITLDSGSQTSDALGLDYGKTYELVWYKGGYDDECSFEFTNPYDSSDVFSASGSDCSGYNNGQIIATFAPPAPAPVEPEFTGHSITLNGYINLNFFVELSEDQIDEEAVVNFEWENGSSSYTLTDADLTENGYKAPFINVPAAYMTVEITARITVGGQDIGIIDSYSVRKYALDILGSNPTPELENLVDAMLTYGAKAQDVFGVTYVIYANQDIDYDLIDVTDNMVDQAIAEANNGATASDMNEVAAQIGGTYYATSVIFLADCTLRHYFTGNLDINDFDGCKSNYYYYVDVPGIPAAQLDTLQEFTVAGVTFTYSALDYVKVLLDNTAPDSYAYKLAVATYMYNQAANTYFDNLTPAP